MSDLVGNPEDQFSQNEAHMAVLMLRRKKKCFAQSNPELNLAVSRLKNAMYSLSLVLRKPVFGVSDQVRHKPGCTVTEDG